MKTVQLSSAQQFVLRHIEHPVDRLNVLRVYRRSVNVLWKKGLLNFNVRRGQYELTDAGRASVEAAK